MLLLTKKINISLPNEDKVHSFLKNIPDEDWEGWTITRKDNTANLNFNVTNANKHRKTHTIQKRVTILLS